MVVYNAHPKVTTSSLSIRCQRSYSITIFVDTTQINIFTFPIHCETVDNVLSAWIQASICEMWMPRLYCVYKCLCVCVCLWVQSAHGKSEKVGDADLRWARGATVVVTWSTCMHSHSHRSTITLPFPFTCSNTSSCHSHARTHARTHTHTHTLQSTAFGGDTGEWWDNTLFGLLYRSSI